MINYQCRPVEDVGELTMVPTLTGEEAIRLVQGWTGMRVSAIPDPQYQQVRHYLLALRGDSPYTVEAIRIWTFQPATRRFL
jgi:hypothetical protein